MTLKQLLDTLLRGRDRLADVKSVADESQKELDSKIQETRDSSSAVIRRAREEIRHSEKIIRVAEQAIRSMKQVEKHH